MNLFRLIGATSLVAAFTLSSVHAAAFVAGVESYIAGTFDPLDNASALTNANAAIGSPTPFVGAATMYPGVFNPFNAHYEAGDLVAIGHAGQVTLRLANYVQIDRTPGTFELGVWENASLIDVDYPNGTAGSPASQFGGDSAVVEVSPDNVHWYALNGGQPILFELPGNYYANLTDPTASTAPANPVLADFGKPFTGTLADFSGRNFAQVLTLLNGSAGGTWLNLDSVPAGVTEIGFVRFSGVASGDSFELDAVSINNDLIGAPTPEPSSAVLGLAGLALGATLRHRRR